MLKKFVTHRHMYHYSATLMRSLATPSIVYIIITGNIVLFVCAFFFFHFEAGENAAVKSYFDAIWWAFSTVTTVGYGDVVPVSIKGRLIAIVLMISGAVFFFGFTAILISVFSSLTTEEVIESERLTKAEYKDVIVRLDDLARRLTELETTLRK